MYIDWTYLLYKREPLKPKRNQTLSKHFEEVQILPAEKVSHYINAID